MQLVCLVIPDLLIVFRIKVHTQKINVFVGNYENNSLVNYKHCAQSIVRCVHKLHCCAVQWQVSSPVECPHKQEVSQSGLSSASYDSVHDIESVEHQVAVQQ